MDWQSLLDDAQSSATDEPMFDETKYLLGIALIVGVTVFGVVIAMFA